MHFFARLAARTSEQHRGIKIRFLAVILILFVFGCQQIPSPDEDYALARVAIQSAKSVEAAKHAPSFWFQAEEAYRRARLHYRRQEWLDAKKEFQRARVAAEKAENSARLIRQKSGEFL